MAARNFIDDTETHNQVLLELGILDDDEDWELFQKQEDVFGRPYYDVLDQFYDRKNQRFILF